MTHQRLNLPLTISDVTVRRAMQHTLRTLRDWGRTMDRGLDRLINRVDTLTDRVDLTNRVILHSDVDENPEIHIGEFVVSGSFVSDIRLETDYGYVLLGRTTDDIFEVVAASGTAEALLQIRDIAGDPSIRFRLGGTGVAVQAVVGSPETAPVLSSATDWTVASSSDRDNLACHTFYSETGVRKWLVSCAADIQNSSGAAIAPPDTIATVPAGFRPGVVMRSLQGFGGGDANHCVIDVEPNGNINLNASSADIPNNNAIHLNAVWFADF